MARPSKFSDVQIAEALRVVESGTSAVAMCRKLGITQTTFYRWRKKFPAATPGAGREMRDLRTENQKLKQIVASFLLEKL